MVQRKPEAVVTYPQQPEPACRLPISHSLTENLIATGRRLPPLRRRLCAAARRVIRRLSVPAT